MTETSGLKLKNRTEPVWRVKEQNWTSLKRERTEMNQLEVLKNRTEPIWSVKEQNWTSLKRQRTELNQVEVLKNRTEPVWSVKEQNWTKLLCIADKLISYKYAVELQT